MRRPSVDAIFFFFQAEDGIRDLTVTGVHVCSSDLKSNTSDDAFALLAVVTNAESIGEEGPQSSPKERFDVVRSEEHTSELQSQSNLVCRLLLEKKKKKNRIPDTTMHAYVI